MSTFTFTSRAAFVTQALDTTSAIYAAPNGSMAHAEDVSYTKDSGSTAIPDIPGWKPFGEVYVTHFGARPEYSLVNAEASTFDSTPALHAAIEYRQWGGTIRLPRGYFSTHSTVVVPYDGIYLIGEGEKCSYLLAHHTDGPVLHVKEQSCFLQSFACLATATRAASTDLLNVGIRFQVEDIPASPGRLKNTKVENVRVAGQPSHGIVVSNAFTGTFSRIWAVQNAGHGVAIDRGFAYPMTNLEGVPGLCGFYESQITDNGGHGFAFGHPDDEFTTQALRITVTNCEISKNATDAVVRYVDAQVYCRAMEVEFTANVFKPEPGSGSSGVYIAGRCITMTGNRFIDVGHVALVGSYDIFPTIGVYITGFNVISSPGMGEAVKVVQTAGQTSIPKGIYVTNLNFGGGVESLMGTEGGGGVGQVAGGAVGGTHLPLYKSADQSVSNSTTLQSDDDLHFWVEPNETVRFTATLEYSSPPAADFKTTVEVPSGATSRFVLEAGVRVLTSNALSFSSVMSAGQAISVGSTDSSHRIVTLRGFVKHSGSSGGDVVVKWGANKADSGPTVVYSGLSCLDIERVL